MAILCIFIHHKSTPFTLKPHFHTSKMEAQTLNNTQKIMKLNNNNGNSATKNDRLSSLPDNLLAQILSLLPLGSAVATSVLSHRWRHLWTHITTLIFDSYQLQLMKFSTFSILINKILPLLTSPKINNFSLRYPYPDNEAEIEDWASCFTSWVTRICTRNPENFKVNLQSPFDVSPLLPLPVCVFETPSLVVLQLSGRFSCVLPDDGVVNLPNLKTLELSLVHMAPDLIAKFVKSCLLLESLCLEFEWVEDGVTMEISAKNLISLDVTMNGKSRNSKFLIDAPKLKHVLFHGSFAFYHVYNPRALADVYLGFNPGQFRGGDNIFSNLLMLLKQISGVRELYLYNNLAVLNSYSYADANLFRKFRNLTGLRLTCVSMDQVNKRAPIPVCLLNKLKWIKLNKLDGSDDDLKLLKYILSKAEVLEELSVCVSYFKGCEKDDERDKDLIWKEFRFCKDFIMLPKKSLACEVYFTGDYLDTSSKNIKNGSLISKVKCTWQVEEMLQQLGSD